jgi:hypothetical protein
MSLILNGSLTSFRSYNTREINGERRWGVFFCPVEPDRASGTVIERGRYCDFVEPSGAFVSVMALLTR